MSWERGKNERGVDVGTDPFASSCQPPSLPPPPTPTPASAAPTTAACRTPWQIINSTKAFSSFATAAKGDAALVALLSDPDLPLSVLVPTNDALSELSDYLDLSRRALLSDPLSAVVLRAHVLNFSAPLRDIYPAGNVTNMLGQRVTLESPAGLAARAADADTTADAPAPATEVAPLSKPRKTSGGARRLAQTHAVGDAPAPSPPTSTTTTTTNDGSGNFLNTVLSLFAGLFTSNNSTTMTPEYRAQKARHACLGGCTSAKDWRATAGGRSASILAGNGRTCGGYVHAVDSVLLPLLLDRASGVGGGTVFTVGGGTGDGTTKAATVTVPGDLATANVTVVRVGGEEAAVVADEPVAAPTAGADAAPPPSAAAGATIAPKGVGTVKPKGKVVSAPAPAPGEAKKAGGGGARMNEAPRARAPCLKRQRCACPSHFMPSLSTRDPKKHAARNLAPHFFGARIGNTLPPPFLHTPPPPPCMLSC